MADSSSPSTIPGRIALLGRAAYGPTAALQRSLREAREVGQIEDTLLVLEHDPVVTATRRTEAAELAMAWAHGMPVEPTERGGKATYHGPGQIVVYPLLDLRQHGDDVKQLVCRLEQAMIDTCAAFGVCTRRSTGYPGVWVVADEADGERKIASLGLRVTRHITFHGIALNVANDMAPFGWFTPCGLPDVEMTSIARELGADGPTPLQLDAPEPADTRTFIDAVRDELIARIAALFSLDLRPIDVAQLSGIAREHPVEAPEIDIPRPVEVPA